LSARHSVLSLPLSSRRYRRHRRLHSFPTRRSSDLMVIPREAYQGLTEDVLTVGVPTTLVIHKDLPDDLVYEMAKVFWNSYDEFLDRKSTRLNSSHVKISYAVFCLRKKRS